MGSPLKNRRQHAIVYVKLNLILDGQYTSSHTTTTTRKRTKNKKKKFLMVVAVVVFAGVLLECGQYIYNKIIATGNNNNTV
jgi:hypothetical protein